MDDRVCACLDKYFRGRREEGLPLTAGFVVGGKDFVGKNRFLELVRRRRRENDWSRQFFGVEEFVEFYFGELDCFTYESVCSVFGVSDKVLYNASRDLCGLNGVEDVDGLEDVVLRPEGFGFMEDDVSVKDFALFLVRDVDLSGRRNDVWAAAALLVSAKVI